MWRYALRRLGLAVVIVLVAMAMFGMLHLVPGDPASIALGPRATPEMREEFRVRMGLDKPIPVQFARFVANALQGDLGADVWSRQPVARLVWLALPHTAALTALGIGWALSASRSGASRPSAVAAGSIASPASSR